VAESAEGEITMHLTKKYSGILFVLLAAMSFGLGSIINKLAYEINLTGSQFINLQWLFSSIIFLDIEEKQVIVPKQGTIHGE